MGVWGEPGFVRPSVREAQNPSSVSRTKPSPEKKSETAEDGGGCVSAALNGPIDTPDPKAQETASKMPMREIVEKKSDTRRAPWHKYG